MAPIPAVVIAGMLAAAVLFALVLDLIKIPVFGHLGIAETTATADSADHAKKTPASKPPVAAEQPKVSDAKPETKPQIPPETTAAVSAKTPDTPDAGKKAPPVIQAPAPRENSPGATSDDPTPQMVTRVHQLYEALGREDVQSVQQWDKTHEKVSTTKQ
jgi:hypothetical protein